MFRIYRRHIVLCYRTVLRLFAGGTCFHRLVWWCYRGHWHGYRHRSLRDQSARSCVWLYTNGILGQPDVLGIPLSLVMATKWGWNSPFYLIVVMATIMGIVMLVKMQPVTKHLSLRERSAIQRASTPGGNAEEEEIPDWLPCNGIVTVGWFYVDAFRYRFR